MHRACAEGAAAMMMVMVVIATDSLVKVISVVRTAAAVPTAIVTMRQRTGGGGKEERSGCKGGGEQRYCRSRTRHNGLLGLVSSPWLVAPAVAPVHAACDYYLVGIYGTPASPDRGMAEKK
jgi:hypothetical protein